jgi:hypothetical protein
MHRLGLIRLAVATLAAVAAAGAVDAPTRHGVVFFCPESSEEAVRQLESIRRDGVRLLRTTDPQTAPVPWAEGRSVIDVSSGRTLEAAETDRLVVGPLAVCLFQLR